MTNRKRKAREYAALLDSEGRISGVGPKAGCAINFEFEAYDCLFDGMSSECLQEISEDCKRLFAVKELVQQTSNYSEGRTHFVRADTAAPRTPLETFALKIFNFHTRDIECDASSSGAEYWTQCIDRRDDIGLHFDRDYTLEEMCDINAYPQFSTVTYVKSDGGATLVFDKKGPSSNSEGVETQGIKKLTISRPRVGKHIKFDGRLLHFAPSKLQANHMDEDDDDEDDDDEEEEEEEGEESVLRITFLVNIWCNHIPLGCIDSAETNSSSGSSIYKDNNFDDYILDFSRLKLPIRTRSSTLRENGATDKTELSTWILHHGDDRYVVEVPLVGLFELDDRYKDMDLVEIYYSDDDVTGLGICIRKESKDS